MAACVPITQEKIRGEVYLGDTLLAKTPFLTNFTVTQTRNNISTTFTATLEIIGGTSLPLGEKLSIKAGTKGNERSIFTGVIESTSAQPTFGKPSYFTVTLGGRGVLSTLENKTFSRRLKADGQGLFCLITGGATNRPQAYYSLDQPNNQGNRQVLNKSPNPAARHGEHSPFVMYNENSDIAGVGGGEATKYANRIMGGDGEGGGGFRQHTHEDLEQGGPAFAVYSAD